MIDREIKAALARWNMLADQWDEIERRIREIKCSLLTARVYCNAANVLYAERSDTLYFAATTWPDEPDPDAKVVFARSALSAAAQIKRVNQRIERNIPVKRPVAIKTLLDLHITSDDVAVESYRRWPEGDPPNALAASLVPAEDRFDSS
jgi:hypothetical protein